MPTLRLGARGDRGLAQEHPVSRAAAGGRQPSLRHPRRPDDGPPPGDAAAGRLQALRPQGLHARAPDLANVVLPVDYAREATTRNLATRAEALRQLGQGGAVAIFPGGSASTAATPLGWPLDPGWRTFTARMVARSAAAMVPTFVEGHSSRLFQVASPLRSILRGDLLVREFRARVGTPVRVAIGHEFEASCLTS